jgi:integrase
MSKLKVSFYLKKDKIKNEKSAIYAKIALGRTTTTMFTGQYICPLRWKSTNMLQQAKRIPREISLKDYIYDIPTRITDEHVKLLKEGRKDMSALELKNSYLGVVKIEKSITLLDVFDIHNSNFKKRVTKQEVSDGSLEKYERVRKIIKTFLLSNYRIKDIPFNQIDNKFVFDFDEYLRYEKPNDGKRGIGNNTTVKYISNIKTMVNFSRKRGLVKSNPFDVYDKKLQEVDTVFLTQRELEKVESLIFETQRLDTVRDIFLFSCYTSYSPVDSMNLKWKNVEDDAQGDKWIRTKRQKSGVKSDIVILPPVWKIIKKYRLDPRCVDEDRLLPDYSNQKMNEYLKEIADLAGIKKRLTWYVSRHTFATTVCLSNKIPLEYVSKLMGHRNITQTQHYAKLLDSVVKTETNKLKEIYSK